MYSMGTDKEFRPGRERTRYGFFDFGSPRRTNWARCVAIMVGLLWRAAQRFRCRPVAGLVAVLSLYSTTITSSPVILLSADKTKLPCGF
jgi:hypothetical protein